eukprot:2692235-Rhodomonas_salina.3
MSVQPTTVDKDANKPVELGKLNNYKVKKIMLPSPNVEGDNTGLFESKASAVVSERARQDRRAGGREYERRGWNEGEENAP